MTKLKFLNRQKAIFQFIKFYFRFFGYNFARQNDFSDIFAGGCVKKQFSIFFPLVPLETSSLAFKNKFENIILYGRSNFYYFE